MTDATAAVLDVHERPSPALWGLLSLQHLFAMFGATVLVPLLTGLDPSVALATSGLGTLLFILLTKGRNPAYLGSSFAYIAPILAAAALPGPDGQPLGPTGAMLGAFLAGAVYLAVAACIKGFGVGWLLKLLPPVVTGPVIVVIGLGLAPVAVNMAFNEPGTGVYSGQHLLVAAATLGLALLFAIVLRGIFSVVPILLAVLGGYVVAAIVGLVPWGGEAGMAAKLAAAPFVEMPNFAIPFVTYDLPWAQAGAIVLLLVPVALVTIAEHIGDQMVISRVIGRNTLVDPGLHRSLAGDGLATMLAAFLGGPPNTTYGENVGVLAITRIFSIYVIGGAAVLALLLAFLGDFRVALQSIPVPVIGGVAIALFGVIAASGLRTLIEGKVDLGDKRNLLIVSIILVLGIGGAVVHVGAVAQLSGTALAAIVGVVLNAVLPHSREEA
ncbi:solute carrier family 23 protein [Oceanibaculum pacificum]|uniref:Uracil permease n=1 Tax=Oceanibaculum pacificum TaxID=580166 RepID=A0A154VTQ2_9PROT|nr:solute carrier family 23 protein [Oceanibaculum pacificum]KZD04693.1 uracil permease [Oceanibaculum pacificum]